MESERKKFSISDIMTWSDEVCEKMDNVIKFSIKDIRDKLRLIDFYYRNYQTYQAILSGGYLKGYIIKCPNCGVEYEISHAELNRGHEITCQDCGHSYKQTDNIESIVCYDDWEGETNEG